MINIPISRQYLHGPLCLPWALPAKTYHGLFDLSWGNDFYTSQKLGRCFGTVPENDGFQIKDFKQEDIFNGK